MYNLYIVYACIRILTWGQGGFQINYIIYKTYTCISFPNLISDL